MRGARTDDFDFDLPEGLIAQVPLARRDASRLLILSRMDGAVSHVTVADLPRWLRAGDLLVLNDTRVLPCRLYARRASGARLEFLLLRPEAGVREGGAGQRREASLTWRALVRPLRRVRVGEALALEGGVYTSPVGASPASGEPGAVPAAALASTPPADATPARAPDARVRVRAVCGDGEVVVAFEGPMAEEAGVRGILDACGAVPLPPYIRAPLTDPERYQTVYGRVEGSAAAPTAGLHFTPELLAAVRAAGIATAMVTLHVGLGTFRPVTVERPEEHRMHAEWFCVPEATSAAVEACRTRGGRVVAVGTTVLRTLEARVDAEGRIAPGEAWTDLYVLPGWRFRAVDGLLTNFHLPRSTLLMLVSAFAGRERVLAAYREAVRLRYRFFSFGDAMLVI